MKHHRKKSATEALCAGGSAGMIARTCVAPIERMKIIYQTATKSSMSGYAHLPRQILEKEGLRGFWKGNSAAVARVVPYTAVTFLAFEYYHSLTSQFFGPLLADLLGGALAGVTAVGTTYPLDLVRARLAVQTARIGTGPPDATPYRGISHALRTIWATEGFLGLYRGISATVVGVAPYAGIKFASYEGLKRSASGITGKSEEDLHPAVRMVAGASSGVIALTCIYPTDVLRRRAQTHKGPNPLYPSVLAGLKALWHEGGISKGLYRGVMLNYLKTAPNVMLYMSLYDIFAGWIRNLKRDNAMMRM
jgi:hypothetical protein